MRNLNSREFDCEELNKRKRHSPRDWIRLRRLNDCPSRSEHWPKFKPQQNVFRVSNQNCFKLNNRFTMTTELYPELLQFLSARQQEFASIPDERKQALREVAQFIDNKQQRHETAKLTFICTHNSRRSHLSQIWAKVAAAYCGLSDVETFSGGTEATAFNPRAVASMRRSGLKIDANDASSANPIYHVRFSDTAQPLECFSKVFNQPPNPTAGYCAVMTCSQADDACPMVMGCDLRAPIRYEDPKVADDTPNEAAMYDERSRQICREMLFLMSQVQQKG